MTGTLITFEGLDGAGKTTQLELATAWLTSLDKDILVTQEPGGTVLGKEVRQLLKDNTRDTPLSPNTQLMLFAASFAQKWDEVLKPALDSGKTILSDRGIFSTVSYQGYAGGLGPEYVRNTVIGAFGGRTPDLTLFFDLDPVERANRLGNRGGTDAIESLGDAYFERVRNGFYQLAKNGDVIIIDANGTPEEVFRRTKKIIAAHLILN